MRLFFKKIINGALAPVNLKVIKAYDSDFSGINLFSDLRLLINIKNPVCFDVGANIGQTIDSLTESLHDPYIYSFEPTSDTFDTLKSRSYGNRVFLFNHALGSKSEEREIINYQEYYLNSFLPMEPSEENPFRNATESTRDNVQIKTLDEFLDQHNITNVDLLKIDTQGFELDVLRGAEKALADGVVRFVLIEINFIEMYKAQPKPEDIISVLEQNGLFLIDYYEKVRKGNTLAWCTALFGKR